MCGGTGTNVCVLGTQANVVTVDGRTVTGTTTTDGWLGIVTIDDHETVDGMAVQLTTTGDTNVSGIGSDDGTGDGVGIETITVDGTELGTNSYGTMMFDDGKMITQTDLGAYEAGMTTPPTGTTEVGGKNDEWTDGAVTPVM